MTRCLVVGLLAIVVGATGCSKPAEKGVWGVATGQQGGIPMLARFRLQRPPGVSTADFPKLEVITWRYASQQPNRMPDKVDLLRLDEFEGLLERHIERKGIAHLLMVETGNGIRKYDWYARNDERFRKALQRALASQGAFPIEVVTRDDPRWTAHQKYLDAVRRGQRSLQPAVGEAASNAPPRP